MNKLLTAVLLVSFSSFTVACSDKDKANHQDHSTVISSNSNESSQLNSAQKTELAERKQRAAQKGNILDSFDSNNVEKPKENKKSSNILDSFDSNNK